jgi:hypothetical protein
MSAQKKNELAGAYQLRGVMEMASGFMLNPDSTFQFYFSYGALDRSGEGTWTVKDNKIIFNSRTHHEKDFTLLSSKKTNDDALIIKITEPNTFFLSHVYCVLNPDKKRAEGLSDNQGIIRFPKQAADSISLAFEFCPERISVFTGNDPGHNYFEFRFEPWIMEVFFSDYSLSIDKEGLAGKHPLLTGEGYHFVKYN